MTGDEDSLLGGLPKRRPAVRSPRREARQVSGEHAQKGPDEGASATPGGGIEGLARAGVAVAWEAASVGLRIAGRAAEQLRGTIGR